MRKRKDTLLGSPLCLGVVAIACVMATAGPALAELPAERAVLILLRSLAYDRNLKDRAGDGVHIAVVYNPTSAGKAEKKKVLAAMKKAAEAKLGGLEVSVEAHEYSTKAKLETAIANGVDTLYLTDSMSSDLGPIKDVAKTHSVVTLGGTRSDVGKGLCLAVDSSKKKPKLLAHLDTCADQGVEFSAKLLRLVETID